MHALRVRPFLYFAMGAAVTVVAVWSLSAWRASAAVSADESTFVPVTPTRILDTRSDIGLAGPFTSAASQDLLVTGGVAVVGGGTAVVVPEGATGVTLNVTAVGPTADGFVTIRPANAPGLPTTSNLNFKAGDIIPNSVTVQLPTSGTDAGRIEITYDAFGTPGPTTEILIDVVGYTKNAGLASLQAQVTLLQSRIDQFSQVDVSNVLFNGDAAGGTLTGTYPNPTLAAGSVDSSKVLDGTLLAGDLAANSVTTSKIGDTAVTGAKVLDGTLSDLDLADNSVFSGEIASGAVGADEVATNSLTVDDLGLGSVGASELVDDTVGMTEMNAIIGDDVLVDSVVALAPGQCELNKVITATGAAAGSRVLVLLSRLQDGAVVNPGWVAYGGDAIGAVDTVRITVCNHTGAGGAVDPPAMRVSFIAIGP